MVALYDADVKDAHKKEKGVYFTDGVCFEMDLSQTMLQREEVPPAFVRVIQAAGRLATVPERA